MTNKNGLSRNIPSDIKLQIRKNSYFGCIICGCGIYEYEHVDPEFKDAAEHDPNKMTILCPTCHSKVTKKLISKAKLKLYMQNPKCKELGYSNDTFSFDADSTVILGSCKFKNISILTIEQIKLLSILPSFDILQPLNLNAIFYDTPHKRSLQIKDNEWQANSDSWDIEVYSRKIIIKNAPDNIVLQLSNNPDSKQLIIEKLNMNFFGYNFFIDGNNFYIKNKITYMFENLTFYGNNDKSSAFYLNKHGDLYYCNSEIKLEGFYGGGVIKICGDDGVLFYC